MKRNSIISAILLLLALGFLGACTTHSLRRPEDRIRASVLKRTPVGTSRDTVDAYIEKRGWQNYTQPGQRQHITVTLGFYHHGMLLPYSPVTDVSATWLFGTNDQVLDIQVSKITHAGS